MTRISPFYMLIAVSIASTINSAHGYYMENAHGPCTSPDVESGGTCLFCMPSGYGRDEAAENALMQWTMDGDMEDWCPVSICDPFSIDIADVFFAEEETPNDEEGRYLECTTDGWVTKYDLSACDDFSIYGGTYTNCCAPHESDGKWECGDFSEKFCDEGYYGIFNGGENDCTRCPEGYGTTQNPNVKQYGWSDAGYNNTINGCYMFSGSNYADPTGTFKMTNSCYW